MIQTGNITAAQHGEDAGQYHHLHQLLNKKTMDAEETHYRFKVITQISVEDSIKFFSEFGRFPEKEEICLIDAYGYEDAIRFLRKSLIISEL